jgi:hypothetical protein
MPPKEIFDLPGLKPVEKLSDLDEVTLRQGQTDVVVGKRQDIGAITDIPDTEWFVRQRCEKDLPKEEETPRVLNNGQELKMTWRDGQFVFDCPAVVSKKPNQAKKPEKSSPPKKLTLVRSTGGKFRLADLGARLSEEVRDEMQFAGVATIRFDEVGITAFIREEETGVYVLRHSSLERDYRFDAESGKHIS